MIVFWIDCRKVDGCLSMTFSWLKLETVIARYRLLSAWSVHQRHDIAVNFGKARSSASSSLGQ